MARTDLVVSVLEGSFGDYGANQADVTMAAADIVDKNQFTLHEGDIVVVHNTNVGVQTVTIESSPDMCNREQDITTYSLAADDYAAFGPFKGHGWTQPADGQLYLEASAVDVLLGVLRQR